MLRLCQMIATFIQRAAHLLEWLPPLAARISVGWVFAEAGWGHLHNVPAMITRFTNWKIPHPELNVYVSGYTEVIGGCLLMAGLFTRITAIPLIINMVVALSVAVIPDPHGVHAASDLYSASEYLYILLMLWLLVYGPGKISVDYLLKHFLGRSAETPAGHH